LAPTLDIFPILFAGLIAIGSRKYIDWITLGVFAHLDDLLFHIGIQPLDESFNCRLFPEKFFKFSKVCNRIEAYVYRTCINFLTVHYFMYFCLLCTCMHYIYSRANNNYLHTVLFLYDTMSWINHTHITIVTSMV
jgi:hypothetical protein